MTAARSVVICSVLSSFHPDHYQTNAQRIVTVPDGQEQHNDADDDCHTQRFDRNLAWFALMSKVGSYEDTGCHDQESLPNLRG